MMDPEELRSARESAGLTQQQLADAAGVSRATIVAIEKGRAGGTKASTWSAISGALRGDHRAAEYLAGYVGSPYAVAQKPTSQELMMVQKMLELGWPKKPNPQTVYFLIEALRS